jgi:Arc/MetJ family transcription regulator
MGWEQTMTKRISVDDALVAEVMSATGQTSRRAAIEDALRTVLRLKRQREAFEQMRGMGWHGDLEAMREGRGG